VLTIIKGCNRIKGLITSVAENVLHSVEVVQRWLEDVESALREMSGEPAVITYF
jgi:hypothetical protein